jgi:hypothetical protein
VEAEEWEKKLYGSFLQREVKREMQHPDANAYSVASTLRYVFPQDDVYEVTRGIYATASDAIT